MYGLRWIFGTLLKQRLCECVCVCVCVCAWARENDCGIITLVIV